MMTSVTLPSTSGPLHGGFSSVSEETTSSEPEFETPRPVKRCLVTPLADSCKKRRKQSTPVRISSAESDPQCTEGKPTSASTSEPELQCPVCQLYFNNTEQLQNHILSDHSSIECKKEPEDFLNPHLDRSNTSLELTQARSEVPWMNEMQSKEWINPHSLPFSPANSMFLTLPQFAQPENMPRQQIRIFNPDAYCDLCNKEFCNKYFLKTHKANKHGIYSDSPSSEPLVNNVNIASYAAGTIKLPTSVPSVELPTIKTEPKTPALNPFNSIFTAPFATNKFPKPISKLYDNESNENVPNSNGFSSNSESDKVDDQPTEGSCSPRQTETTSFKSDPDAVYYIPQSKVSPSNDLDMSNRLRRIGVMNPKAFCEICCKEYCNKYFLRTHKMKRHGIYIPDEKDKDKDGGQNAPWQNPQTSPLNLIMTDNCGDRKTTSPSDISCEICGIRFQNASLSQLHNASVHPKICPKENEHQEQQQQQQQLEEIKKSSAGADSASGEKSVNAEAISEDLQKLQTMILQLNELDVSKACTTCNLCGKEFENRYFLHAHMMSDHASLIDELPEVEKPTESENSTNNNTMCDLCGKDVQSVEELKKHMLEFHPNNHQEKDEFNNGFTTPEKNRAGSSSGERRISTNVTPTSSYCDICNKELCNKYFMKTHMQRMHGIEIENGAQIGGVICDICNKELCSKYFLRVHKHNTHGIVEYGTSLLQPRKSESGESVNASAHVDPEPAIKPTDLADLSHRYFTHFTEVCSICNRRFRSTKWLKTHLLSDHGQAGAEKWAEMEQQLQQNIGHKSGVKSERASPTLKIPNGGHENQKVGLQNMLSSLFGVGVDESNSKSYQCSFCPFTTPLLPLLFVHERSHSMSSEGAGSAPLKCPCCTQTFLQPELLQHHMFAQHPFIPLPPFFNGSENEAAMPPKDDDEVNIEARTKKIKGKAKRGLFELSPETGQTLKDIAKRALVPAAYALPQQGGEEVSPGYVMQAFLLEESASDRRVVPAVVFLPVFQKQPAPLTVTFTLTPA